MATPSRIMSDHRPDRWTGVWWGELTLSPDDKISFGIFGINEMSVKLNSLDPEHEYWKIGGKIDFSTSIGAFGNTGISGFDGYLSSYYWIPDTVKL